MQLVHVFEFLMQPLDLFPQLCICLFLKLELLSQPLILFSGSPLPFLLALAGSIVATGS